MGPARRPPSARTPALDQRHLGTPTTTLPPDSHRRLQGDQPATTVKRSGGPTTTSAHGTIATASTCPHGGLGGPGRGPRCLRLTQTPASPEARPTTSRRHHAGPNTAPVGQINPLAPTKTGTNIRAAGHLPAGRQPPQHHPTSPPDQSGRHTSWQNSGAGSDGTSCTEGPPPRVQLLDPDPGGGGDWKPDKMPYLASLRLRTGLSKAQSSILTQVRTGKIGLAAFLCKRRVPGFLTLACSCGAQWETAKHIVFACPRLQRARRSLYAAASTTDYQVMTS